MVISCPESTVCSKNILRALSLGNSIDADPFVMISSKIDEASLKKAPFGVFNAINFNRKVPERGESS